MCIGWYVTLALVCYAGMLRLLMLMLMLMPRDDQRPTSDQTMMPKACLDRAPTRRHRGQTPRRPAAPPRTHTEPCFMERNRKDVATLETPALAPTHAPRLRTMLELCPLCLHIVLVLRPDVLAHGVSLASHCFAGCAIPLLARLPAS